MPQLKDGPTSSLRPISRADFGYDEARHLLWRAGFGGSPDQIRTLADWGPERAVEHLLEVEQITSYPMPTAEAFEHDIMRPPSEEERREYRLALRNQDENAVARFRAERQRRQRQDRRQISEMQRWWLTRMIETPRPLEEKMTLFWHGHLATGYRTIENSYHMFLQNQLFRSHAIGNFGELLFRIIRDPAMIKYLDNDESRKGAPNENLARELMELFSLGVGNYSEQDIKEGARALTGYSFDYNDFIFREEMHDDGVKSILGKRGQLDGDDFVRAILERKACSAFITAKLYRFFVNSIPERREHPRFSATRSVVMQLASTFLRSKYDLKPMLQRLFLSEHFYDPVNRLEQIKSPVTLVVGAVRSLQTPVRDLGILNDALDLMGQNLFYPPNVKGWEGGRSWMNTSTLYVRQNILNFLLTGKTPSGYDALAELERYDPTILLNDLKATDPGAEHDPERVVLYLTRFTLGQTPPSDRLAVLTDFIDQHGGRITPDIVTGLLALLTAMPEYQLT